MDDLAWKLLCCPCAVLIMNTINLYVRARAKTHFCVCYSDHPVHKTIFQGSVKQVAIHLNKARKVASNVGYLKRQSLLWCLSILDTGRWKCSKRVSKFSVDDSHITQKGTFDDMKLHLIPTVLQQDKLNNNYVLVPHFIGPNFSLGDLKTFTRVIPSSFTITGAFGEAGSAIVKKNHGEM